MNAREPSTARQPAPDYDALVDWLRATVAELISVEPQAVDPRTPFTRFGVDSASALIVTDMLSDWLGLELDATLLYEHETIEQLARHLSAQLRSRAESGSDR